MVSIIIPNYNHALFLEKRIESVLNQTFQNFEIILLDDCSTDGSIEILEGYRLHDKVTALKFNTCNSGSPFKQWKKGIELALGEYIWIAESDDWCEANFLDVMMAAFNGGDNVVLAHCQSLCIRGEAIEWRTSNNFLKEERSGIDYNFQYMLGYNGIPNASGVVFKKEAFLKIQDEYTKMKYCGDWYIWSQICKQGSVFTSGKYLNYFNKHQADITGRATAEGLDFTEGNLIMLKMIEEDKPSNEYIGKALGFRLSRLESLKYCFTDPGMYPSQKDILMQLCKQHSIEWPIDSKIKNENIIKKIFRKFNQVLLKKRLKTNK